MADQNFKGMLVGLVIFVLFTWLILTVVVDMGEEYNRDTSTIANGSLDVEDYKQEASEVGNKSSDYRERFSETGGDLGFGDEEDKSGIFSIVSDMGEMVITPFTLLGKIMSNILNVPRIVINVLLGLFAISLILAIWKLIRVGK